MKELKILVDFNSGDKVFNNNFGNGEIKFIIGTFRSASKTMVADIKYEVEFDNIGLKILQAKDLRVELIKINP